jgi:serine/threonine-protein kinase
MSHHEQGTTEETPTWSSDSTASPVRDLTGATLGDFQVKRLLGRGGMGQVYLATQISLNRSVALKVLHPRYLSKPIYLSRFEAEATAVAKLNHPNIVQVYTLGYIDQVRFIAMEYVEGTNLREYINKKGALEPQTGFAAGPSGRGDQEAEAGRDPESIDQLFEKGADVGMGQPLVAASISRHLEGPGRDWEQGSWLS